MCKVDIYVSLKKVQDTVVNRYCQLARHVTHCEPTWPPSVRPIRSQLPAPGQTLHWSRDLCSLPSAQPEPFTTHAHRDAWSQWLFNNQMLARILKLKLFTAQGSVKQWYFDNYTVFRKKHPLTFSFISPWIICGFKTKIAVNIPKDWQILTM